MVRLHTNKKDGSSRTMLRIGKLLLVLGIVMMFSVKSFADDGDDDGSDDPDRVPFDGGVSLLVISGLAYGAKRWHDEARKDKEKDNTVSEV